MNQRDRELRWVERIADYLARDGIPPIAGRVLGWLMICQPAEQSPAEIATAIGCSRASLTSSLRVLTAAGFVTRHSRPGERTGYYRVDDDAWGRTVRAQIASIAILHSIADDGIELVGADSPRIAGLESARDVFTWMADAFDRAPPMPTPRTEGQQGLAEG